MQTSIKPRILTYEEYHEKINNLKQGGDVNTFVKELVAPAIQAMLDEELTQHLGYEKNEVKGHHTGNTRNGYSPKNLRTSFGTAPILVPRDRNANFEPKIVPKYETVQSDVEEKIISMYAKGMTTRDIHAHMEDLYGVSISASSVSSITDKVLPLVAQWQARQLASLYAIIYLDGIHFKVRQDGHIVTKCAYIALGITDKGVKEVLGIWIGEAEGSKFWMHVLSDIKNRGVQDILIACVDGLNGFNEAIGAIFPRTEVQLCIVHQVRNTTKFIPHKDKKAVSASLRKIYTASTEEAGRTALEETKKEFPQYAIYLKSWETKWPLLSPFFAYPEEIRRIIYTTNAIEGLNRQYRKVTKTTSLFPSDESLAKLLYLATQDITKKWTNTVHNWGLIVAQLSILFPERTASLISNS